MHELIEGAIFEINTAALAEQSGNHLDAIYHYRNAQKRLRKYIETVDRMNVAGIYGLVNRKVAELRPVREGGTDAS